VKIAVLVMMSGFTFCSGLRAIATDVWVDAVNGLTTNTGLSSGSPVKTISHGVDIAKGLMGGARVRVSEGTYNVALGEVFPIEIGTNISCDPLFVDVGGGDYHLDGSPYLSPCIDSGTNFPALGLPAADIDNEDRTVNGNGEGSDEVDMGADEYDPGG
jgi:hypothetical protein